MFPESFDEIVGAGKVPGCQQMGLGFLRAAQAHIVHHSHQMQVNGGNRVHFILHGQGRFHHAQTFGVISLQ